MKYLIKKGDTLSELAKHFGVTVSDIMVANPKIKNPDLIYEGDTLDIPVFGGFFSKFWKSIRDIFGMKS